MAGAATVSFASSEFLNEIGHEKDAGAVMSKLTSMMGAAQQKLGVAQRHHKKVVKKIRKEAGAFLDQESKVYGKYLNDYSTELSKATAELQQAVDEAKAGIKKSEAAPSNPNDWKDPSVEQRAKLGAQVAAAERTIKRSERRQARQLREGEERAEENMEDESQKLGMKLGDMTPLVDASKKTLEAAAEKTLPVLAASKVADVKTDKSAKVDLQGLEDKLAKASKSAQAKTADVNKKLDGFLTKTGKEVADKTKKIQGDLEKAQKEEIEKVLGRKTEAKAAPAKKVAPKAAPAKKVEAKAAKKIEAKPAPAAPKAAPAKAQAVKK